VDIKPALNHFNININTENDVNVHLCKDQLSLLRLSLLFPTLIVSLKAQLYNRNRLTLRYVRQDGFIFNFTHTWPGGFLFLRSDVIGSNEWYLWYSKYKSRAKETHFMNHQDFEDIESFFDQNIIYPKGGIIENIKKTCYNYDQKFNNIQITDEDAGEFVEIESIQDVADDLENFDLNEDNKISDQEDSG
jgi:hypothetical protein